jgi:hypothetical protein
MGTIVLPDGKEIKHNPTIREKIVFTEWLREQQVYDDFIKRADLAVLSKENEPECFFVSLGWDEIEIEDSVKNNDCLEEWNGVLDSWLRFIACRDWTLISSGIESNEEYEKELFNRKVIEKLNKMNFNKLTHEQYKEIDKILK